MPSVAQAILGSVDALSVRAYPTRGNARTRLYITAEQRGSHVDCPYCDDDGMTFWFTPQGTQEQRPCTGIEYEDLLAAGLARGPRRREPWRRSTDA
ncbi:hypothetical protein [Streptomyces canus]|uniref:hypothetical protein n=1 Tax=Streptomyces canus TaxID=58343 RepID=UPI00224D9471|nr:hypothetical protein [Streptomyces canus]MCX4859023.1 hypothetical protein [Streptomyces canus]